MVRAFVFIASILFAFIGPACSNTNESELPLHAPGLSTPVVTGLRITGINGPTQLAIWGIPSDPVTFKPPNTGGGAEVDTGIRGDGGLPGRYDFATPYPNPNDGQAVFSFALPRDSRVSLWIVRARWHRSPNTDLISIGGSTVPAPNNHAIWTLLHNYTLSAGSYRATWDGRDNGGNSVPAGFYRVYFKADDFISWRDMLLYRSLEDLPGDLRAILHR